MHETRNHWETSCGSFCSLMHAQRGTMSSSRSVLVLLANVTCLFTDNLGGGKNPICFDTSLTSVCQCSAEEAIHQLKHTQQETLAVVALVMRQICQKWTWGKEQKCHIFCSVLLSYIFGKKPKFKHYVPYTINTVIWRSIMRPVCWSVVIHSLNMDFVKDY